ncbi:hypothetical protein BJ138DRAFT_1157411 [Hygrophoropsis aurantiaca]|uniref:Uncharacterized protein n=1 Tax=Hygrophoropsis aurantiaca TaxID=72124 RepID=A0ACB8A6D6_9AGAM|nr:hypothetical protein BJ138DRAFT_1157411 [Hygrophoropsis aurantiaca]
MPAIGHIAFGAITFVLTLNHGAAAAVDFVQCLQNIQNDNSTSITGLLFGNGTAISSPLEIPDVAAVTYEICIQACGNGQEAFSWSTFSQKFGAWLLPYLALISQLPFGARRRPDNFMSVFLTVGSPVLAGYSMYLTLLNARWVRQSFEDITYSNSKDAARVLISLQQVPLRVTEENGLLPSLVVLPENDKFWEDLVHFLNYSHTWSISALISIIWVAIAFSFTVADSFANMETELSSSGQGVGSVWLWLIPIVSGWLLLSPKCDHKHLKSAVDRANDIAFVATSNGPVKASSLSGRSAITIDALEDKLSSPDEKCTPPVFNYARALSWARAAEDTLNVFRIASLKARDHKPVTPGDWQVREGAIDSSNRSGSLHNIQVYCGYLEEEELEVSLDESVAQNLLPSRASQSLRLRTSNDVTTSVSRHSPRGRLPPGVYHRMFLASLMSLLLQWGTTGAAVLALWLTPTTGLGCWSLSYFIYGGLSTLVWVLLVASSRLGDYSTSRRPRRAGPRYNAPLAIRLAKRLSNIFRFTGKILAVVNAIGLVASSVFQFSSVYDDCYCNGSVLGRGQANSYVVLNSGAVPNLGQTKGAWIGSVFLASGCAAIFVGFIYLFNDSSKTD